MPFRIHGLDISPFTSWFDLTDDELAARGARRVIADSSPGFPCRATLEDAAIGEELLLVPYEHHATTSPYRGAGPVFIRRVAPSGPLTLDHVPDVLTRRVLSVRAFDSAGMMIDANVIDGRELAAELKRMLAAASYVHVHFAKPGCFACRVAPEL